MQVWNTYYYLAREADYSGLADTALRTTRGELIARVPAAFAADFCIEGSGQLRDGRVVNYAAHCADGYVCRMGGSTCYSVLDAGRFPWGKGVQNRPLVPLRSWATDPAVIPYGTVLYAPRWDGLRIPAVDGLGGFTHDGCFQSVDTGGAIRGGHVDVFAGTRAMWRALERLVPTRTEFEARPGDPRCAGVAFANAPPGGGAGAVLALGALAAGGYALYRWAAPRRGRRRR